jgi:hypothetical protein
MQEEDNQRMVVKINSLAMVPQERQPACRTSCETPVRHLERYGKISPIDLVRRVANVECNSPVTPSTSQTFTVLDFATSWCVTMALIHDKAKSGMVGNPENQMVVQGWLWSTLGCDQ